MFTYKLRNTVIATRKELSPEVQRALSGEFKGGMLQLISHYKLGRKHKWLSSYSSYYYAPTFGLVRAEDWDKYLPKSFLEGRKTITQVCVEYGVPRSFDRFLKTSETYKQFVNSSKYKHLLGMLNHTKHVCYGTIVNTKKTDNVFLCNRSKQSRSRVSVLLQEANLILLEEWQGTRCADNSIRYYKVKCGICGLEFETWMHSSELRVCPRCKDGKFSSVREAVMKDYIESLGFEVWQSYRGLIKSPGGLPMELDLYLPNEQIAFEFNGYRFHTSTGSHAKPSNYHQYKTVQCLLKGVVLYHIWSDVPDDLCESFIASKLGKSYRISARKCDLGSSTSHFMIQNHIDGDCSVTWSRSLFHKGKEVCSLWLKKRGSSTEIVRFANAKGMLVVGGFSRLLSRAVEWAREGGYKTVFVYCNRDLSPDPSETVYARTGFTFMGYCPNTLKYTNYSPVELNGEYYKSNSVLPGYRCCKQALLNHLNVKTSQKSEAQLAEELGLYQVYNSGNLLYEKALV